MYKHGTNLRLLDERSIFIGDDVIIGDNVTIYENNRIEGACVIGDGVVLYPGNLIRDTSIDCGSLLYSTHAEQSEIGARVSVGPYAHLRAHSRVRDGAKIGNFVEIKNSVIGEGSKVAHLAYVGDADVGKGCNIGCGAIFVNYNGKSKSRITVGDNCFIGSNCNLIAPLVIEKNSYVCAATTVNVDVGEGDFVIGRARQEIKHGRAYGYLKEVW